MKKVMFISSTGGHLDELQQLNFNKYDYSVVTERTVSNSDLKNKYPGKVYFLAYGTRKNLIKYFFIFIFNFFRSLYLFFKLKPDVVVTTGTHTAVPMCYIAHCNKKKVIWIETFANRSTKTLAGKIVYPIADTFVVQWDEMKKLYPKAVYWGAIY